MGINSKRKYTVSTHENGVVCSDILRLAHIMSDDNSEVIYAMQDIMDDILDLKVDKHLTFQPNRDNDQSIGLIVRIQ